MIESLRRIRAAANHTPASGIPKVTLGHVSMQYPRLKSRIWLFESSVLTVLAHLARLYRSRYRISSS